MRRRAFITLLCGAAGWPIAALAQQRPPPVIGFLSTASAEPFAHLVAGFRGGLEETGFVEDRNVAVEYRWAEGQYDRLPELAQELVRRQVAVIVTSGRRDAFDRGQGRNVDDFNRVQCRQRPGRHGAGREPRAPGRQCHRRKHLYR
jgi:hypothetical protein